MPTDQKRVQAVFLAAIEQDVRDRVTLLARECGSDAELRQRVEALLQAHDDPGSFLDHATGELGPTIDQPITEKPGTQIGPYKLMEQIGEGGMGVVYVAEQREPVRRRVALKIIKPGMDTKEVVGRFEAERQALALMDHPNIAKVLDAGSTPSGRLYFVMELVKGILITEYCDRCDLPMRERLELFLSVCQAVQHAHQKGIIHRDIKPANVLVAMQDGEPAPKVIDFGVAKAVNQRLTEQTLQTAFAQMLGTPMYMSPEQAEMSPLEVDTRTDVYSLGVLLYELLTGTTPFAKERLGGASFDELRRIIREEEPPRPSARISTLRADLATTVAEHRRSQPHKLSHLVRGELDWIVMQALEKDRTRRYESASALAADVRRYLNDEPVQACPPSLRYRFGKFARRKKGLIAAAAVLLLFVATIAGSLGWIARSRQVRQTQLANQVELILDEVERFMQQQKWPAALATAQRAEPLIAGEDADAPTKQRVHQVLADLKMVQGLEEIRLLRSVITQSDFDNKQSTFDYEDTDQVYAMAFRDWGIDVENLPPEETATMLRLRTSIAVPLAAALDDWVLVRRNIAKSDDASWRALVTLARIVDPDPLRDQLRKLWGKEVTAQLKSELTDLARGEHVGGQPPATLVILGLSLWRVELKKEAISVLRLAQEAYPDDFWVNFQLAYTLGVQNPGDADAIRFYSVALGLRPGNVAVLNNLGLVLLSAERVGDAFACLNKAIEFNPKYVDAYINRGYCYVQRGEFDKAIADYGRAIALDPQDARASGGRGYAYGMKGEHDKAIEDYNEAIRLAPDVDRAFYSRGFSHRAQGKTDDAIADYREAIRLDPDDAANHHALGDTLNEQGKFADAEAAYREAIRLDPDNAGRHHNFGDVLRAQDKLDEAADAYRQAIRIKPSAPSYHNLAVVHVRKDAFDQAADAVREAIGLMPNSANLHKFLGEILRKQDKLAEAKAEFLKAEELMTRNKQKSDDRDRDIAKLLTIFAGPKLRDPKQAFEAANKAVELYPKKYVPWMVLGWARYRTEDWQGSIQALEKSCELQNGTGNEWQWFFLAMAHRKLDHQDDARKWYDQAVKSVQSNNPLNKELRRYAAEASQLFAIPSPFESIDKATRQSLAPPVAPAGKLSYLDLKPVANHKISELAAPEADNHLGELPRGEQKFAGVSFLVGDGLIQLGWKTPAGHKNVDWAKWVKGVKVGKHVAKLYVLHATQHGDKVSESTEIGAYHVHYEDQTSVLVPIVAGKDVRDWWNLDDSKPVSRAIVGWEGTNPLSVRRGKRLRLYVGMWKNPHPSKPVSHVDYISAVTAAAPFCVAMTVEELSAPPGKAALPAGNHSARGEPNDA